ncbi:MAG TPA: EAL domain-containing protein [Thermoanaerobaculia bacterium]|nr:EAL domain-containing protein [Thermoanaerobaculia bacterium]
MAMSEGSTEPDGAKSDPAISSDQLESVKVPEQFVPIFLRAQQHVAAYFADRVENPRLSTISISGERYILVRAASMSVEFFDLVMSLYRDKGQAEARSVASNLLFDLAHAIGKADARTFHERMQVTDPVEKLSAGPIHFSYSGWAFVEIFPESNPAPNEDYYLIYDHPFSFESDAWMKRKKSSDFPVCVMNAGYSSGWCEESFGLPLVAAEVECLASGGGHCRFIMAPPSRIEGHLDRYAAAEGIPSASHLVSSPSIAIPEFFQRKRMEEELRHSRDDLEINVQQRTAELVAEIAERRAAEAQLRLFESAVENAIEGIILLTAGAEGESRRVLFANAGFEKLTGFRAQDALDKTLDVLQIAAEELEVLDRINVHMQRQMAFEGEAIASRADNSKYVLELHVMPVRDREERLTHWVCILRDVSDRKAQLAALEHQAMHDVLTDLPNRVLLLDRLEQALLSSTRHNKALALFIMDLDRFKEVNDTFGHHVGDQILMQVGQRLKNQIRASDTVARLGGDEFAILLPLATDTEHAISSGRKLLRALEAPFIVDQNAFDVGASLGIALAPDHGNDAATLLRRADVAMYIAKQTNSGLAVYSADLDRNSPTRLALMSELRYGIDHGQLLLHYQPKVDLKAETFGHLEALVRWRHPQHGVMPPDEFIPLSERTGLIAPLTSWVLNEALAQCRMWHDAGLELGVAVNLSGRSLLDASLSDLVGEALKRWRVSPPCLTLELTESSIMSDPDHVMRTLEQLRALKVRLSIDDFGTGYSSLSHLRLLPVDEIKIDKSFVLEMLTTPSDEAIVRSTIQLCQNLGRKVVAEGVEDEATFDRLKELGCDYAQGFGIAPPMPAVDLPAWMTASRWKPAR